jgi:acetylglutamate kinase
MKIENEQESRQVQAQATAQVLFETLPWIKEATGKTVVIKYGGSAMVNQELRESVMGDIVLMKIMGINPVLVHGGGWEVSAMMKRLDIPVHFEDGLRVTDEAAIEVVRMVLGGKVNSTLVAAMNQHGNLAVGLNGADAGIVQAKQRDSKYGLVGDVTAIDSSLINDLLKTDYIPVIATIGISEDRQTYYNVNSDTVAGEVAAAIGAHKVIFLTDVDGLYEDFDDKGSLISQLTLSEAVAMLDSPNVSSGMIPKIQAVVTALQAGVPRAHMLNGTTPHSILIELFTDTGIGTMIYREDGDIETKPGFKVSPVDNLAAKLSD